MPTTRKTKVQEEVFAKLVYDQLNKLDDRLGNYTQDLEAEHKDQIKLLSKISNKLHNGMGESIKDLKTKIDALNKSINRISAELTVLNIKDNMGIKKSWFQNITIKERIVYLLIICTMIGIGFGFIMPEDIIKLYKAFKEE